MEENQSLMQIFCSHGVRPRFPFKNDYFLIYITIDFPFLAIFTKFTGRISPGIRASVGKMCLHGLWNSRQRGYRPCKFQFHTKYLNFRPSFYDQANTRTIATDSRSIEILKINC